MRLFLHIGYLVDYAGIVYGNMYPTVSLEYRGEHEKLRRLQARWRNNGLDFFAEVYRLIPDNRKMVTELYYDEYNTYLELEIAQDNLAIEFCGTTNDIPMQQEINDRGEQKEGNKKKKPKVSGKQQREGQEIKPIAVNEPIPYFEQHEFEQSILSRNVYEINSSKMFPFNVMPTRVEDEEVCVQLTFSPFSMIAKSEHIIPLKNEISEIEAKLEDNNEALDKQGRRLNIVEQNNNDLQFVDEIERMRKELIISQNLLNQQMQINQKHDVVEPKQQTPVINKVEPTNNTSITFFRPHPEKLDNFPIIVFATSSEMNIYARCIFVVKAYFWNLKFRENSSDFAYFANNVLWQEIVVVANFGAFLMLDLSEHKNLHNRFKHYYYLFEWTDLHNLNFELDDLRGKGRGKMAYLITYFISLYESKIIPMLEEKEKILYSERVGGKQHSFSGRRLISTDEQFADTSRYEAVVVIQNNLALLAGLIPLAKNTLGIIHEGKTQYRGNCFMFVCAKIGICLRIGLAIQDYDRSIIMGILRQKEEDAPDKTTEENIGKLVRFFFYCLTLRDDLSHTDVNRHKEMVSNYIVSAEQSFENDWWGLAKLEETWCNIAPASFLAEDQLMERNSNDLKN